MSLANILVVEDERIVARDIQNTLQRAGYNVAGTAATGRQALQKAMQTTPDLVLMDVVLAGEIDGIETARQIRQWREIPIVYLTANGDRAVLEKAKSTEPIAFILKPYDEHELLTTIEVALHQYHAQKRRSDDALKQSEARYQELFDTARDGIAVTDLTGRHLQCNRAYLELLGYDADELRRRRVEDLTAPEWHQSEHTAIQQQTFTRGYSDEYEKECIRKDGSRIAVSARCWLRKDPEGMPEGLWVMLRDISERKAAEQRILDYQTRLRSLLKEMACLEEKERQRIATDIHDRISQTLAACQLRLEGLAQAAAFPQGEKEAEEICQLLDRTLRDTSSLIFELSPPVLHQLGLAAALEWFGEKIGNQYGLRVEVLREQSAPQLAPEMRTALFRSACELMNNVAKHARATSARIHLRHTAEAVELSVEDDGIGFQGPDPAAKRERGGFGLFQIRERLWAWGGELQIGPRVGGGTRACIQLPLQNRTSESKKT